MNNSLTWTSVDDALPKENRWVAARWETTTGEDGWHRMCIGDDQQWYPDCADDCTLQEWLGDDHRVTHWIDMLPSLPTEGEAR